MVPMENLRVLVIDDDPSIIELVKIGLESRGMIVEEAETAGDAKRLLEERDYDLVLCDWMLPDHYGDILLAWSKQHPRLRNIPFIMVTAKMEKEFVVKAIKLGTDGYLVKPFTIEKLRHKIESVLEQRPAAGRGTAAAVFSVVARFRNTALRGELADLEGDLVTFRCGRDGKFPILFEELAVDLAQREKIDAFGVRGAVTGLRVADHDPRGQSVEVMVRLKDLTGQNQQDLERLRLALRNQGVERSAGAL